jgi:hypothetical protein
MMFNRPLVVITLRLAEIAQMLRRRLRETHVRVVVLTLYLIDALAHNCGHALLVAFNAEAFMQQIGNVARKYYITPSEAAAGPTPELVTRHEAVSVCLELLSNWSQLFRPNRAMYGNIVDMYDILESEGITSNATLSFSATADAATTRAGTTPSPSLQSQSIDAADASKANSGTGRSAAASAGAQTARSTGHYSDATTSATVFTSDQSGQLRRSESESGADSLFPKAPSPVFAPTLAPVPDVEVSNKADYYRLRRAESASQPTAADPAPQIQQSQPQQSQQQQQRSGGRGHPPLQRSKSKSGDEMHPRKVGSVPLVPFSVIQDGLPPRTGSVDSAEELRPGKRNQHLELYHSPRLDQRPPRDLLGAESKSDCSSSSRSSSTRLSSSELAAQKMAGADGKGPHAAGAHTHKLSGIPELPHGDSMYFGEGADILSAEDREHHRALQSTLSNPAPGKFSPPPLVKQMSPTGPAQKALDDFLQKNAKRGVMVDAELQEELLNQVEIEKRIRDGRQRGSQTLNIVNGLNDSQGNLQLELEHQLEIERSIKEQQLRRGDGFHPAQSGYTAYSAGIAGQGASAAPRSSTKQASQPPTSSGRRHHAHHADGQQHDSDSGEYEGQVVDYADGTNKDFFYVGNTNTYIETESPEQPHRPRHSRTQPPQQGQSQEQYAFPTQFAQSQGAHHTRNGSLSTGTGTATGTSTYTSSLSHSRTPSHGSGAGSSEYHQQVEIQKQIFEEYERKKHSGRHHHSSHRHGGSGHKRRDPVEERELQGLHLQDEVEGVKQRLLRKQENLLSASSMDSSNLPDAHYKVRVACAVCTWK